MGFCGGRGKRGAPKKYYDTFFLNEFFFEEEKMKTREDKRMIKLELINFSKLVLLDIY
jgi:hypothetical protein